MYNIQCTSRLGALAPVCSVHLVTCSRTAKRQSYQQQQQQQQCVKPCFRRLSVWTGL